VDQIIIQGGNSVRGVISVVGAKNACLALMPATLLCAEPLTLTNVPRLSDINTMMALLQTLGVDVDRSDDGRVVTLSSALITNHVAHYDIVRKMRASILVLGPMLARDGQAVVSLPGGCAIGARPVNLHLFALKEMGAELELKDGYVRATASRGLTAGRIEFPSVSVGATENALMAATLARGTTVLGNVAREPEIVDLAVCLRKMGAQISGEGTGEIIVEGVDALSGAEHTVIPDRIELGTYMLAPAVAGGDVEFVGGRRNLLEAFCGKLEESGIDVEETARGLRVSQSGCRPKAVHVVTEPFPGFPTDLQAQMMAMLSTAEGVSILEERIFENRFMHAPELLRMGARIDIQGGSARVTGVKRLKGAPVMATDLRASVSLILAGLAANGETVVNRVYHVDRGYEQVVTKLKGIGADVERIQNS